MIQQPRPTKGPGGRAQVAPSDDLTVVLLRLAASAVTLAVALVVTLAS